MPKLPFIMQTQLQTNWCWAAVSASTSSFFGGPAGASGGPYGNNAKSPTVRSIRPLAAQMGVVRRAIKTGTSIKASPALII